MLTEIQQPRSRLVIIAARNFQKFLIAALLVKPGATGGAYRGRAPQMTACALPNENCAPPSEDCAPKKFTGWGLYWSGNRDPNWCFLWTDIGFHDVFGTKTFFFFLEITCLWPEKPLQFPISAGKSPAKSVKTCFFLEITCFRPEKPLEFPISAGKSL